MISEGHVYLLNPGETVSLECNFHADEYDLFEYPVLWRKTQQGEVMQVSVMGTVMDPFLVSGRFEVTFTSTASRYRLVLTISGRWLSRQTPVPLVQKSRKYSIVVHLSRFVL